MLQAGFSAAFLGAVLGRARIAKLCQWLSPGKGGAKVLATQLPPRFCLPTNLAAIALSGYAAHRLGLAELAHDQRLRAGQWEEVPFSGRLRPALPAITEREQLLRDPARADAHSTAVLQMRGARCVAPYACTTRPGSIPTCKRKN